MTTEEFTEAVTIAKDRAEREVDSQAKAIGLEFVGIMARYKAGQMDLKSYNKAVKAIEKRTVETNDRIKEVFTSDLANAVTEFVKGVFSEEWS